MNISITNGISSVIMDPQTFTTYRRQNKSSPGITLNFDDKHTDNVIVYLTPSQAHDLWLSLGKDLQIS